jgi:hypothetical protein
MAPTLEHHEQTAVLHPKSTALLVIGTQNFLLLAGLAGQLDLNLWLKFHPPMTQAELRVKQWPAEVIWLVAWQDLSVYIKNEKEFGTVLLLILQCHAFGARGTTSPKEVLIHP